MDKLQKMYYSPGGLVLGRSAARKLKAKIPDLKQRQIQHWLDRQSVYQVYKAKPKRIKFPHYTQDQPNHTHQIDLVPLPTDNGYKMALTVVDIASRYKEAEPLKKKTAFNTTNAILRIYERSPLNFPKLIMCDKGREFMGEFSTLMKERGTRIERSFNKKKVAFVERFNRTLAERVFAHQYAKEISEGKTNREWVEGLPAFVRSINGEETRLIGMKPIEAIKLDNVPQPEYERVSEMLPIDSLVRYLYKPGEEQGDTRYRATDPIWSVDVFSIDEIHASENQPAVYTLQGIDERTFTEEQLQVVPPDTEGLNSGIINDRHIP